MADTSKYITIKDAVNSFMMLTRADASDFKLLYNIACKGIIELNLWAIEEGRQTAKLTMDSNYMAALPSDMLTFIALGVPVKGKLYRLTRDEGIITTTTLDGETETLDTDYGEGVDINPEYGGSYAAGSNNLEGYYRIDYKNNRIVFRNVERTEILLEYTGSGLSLSGTTYVPSIALRALEAFMMWEFYKYKVDFPENKIYRYEQDYLNRKSELIGLRMPTLDEMLDVWYGSMHQSLKR